MKKISFFLLVLLVTTALGVVLHHYMTTPKEQGVAYLQSAKMDLFSPLSAYSSSYALSEKSKPHELLDLPDGISGNNDDTQFFSLPVGKNRVFVVIHKPGQNTATAWVDTNMNNHLSDEIPLSGKAIKYTENKSNRNYFYFGNVCLKDENISFAPIHLTCLKDRGYIIAQPISYLKGKIKLGGHIYRVAIVDGDYDGQFNTLYSHSEGTQYLACDKIVIDYNK